MLSLHPACRRVLLLCSLSTVLGACGNKTDNAAPDLGVADVAVATDTRSTDVDVDAADVASDSAPETSVALGEQLDIHMHCNPTEVCDGLPCCSMTAWNSANVGRTDPAAVLLSLEHYTVLQTLKELPAEKLYLTQQNASMRAQASKAPTLLWFASLPCWHTTKWGTGWLAACKAEVDSSLAQGARGFKDHVGKTFAHAGLGDPVRWLGAWNRANGSCPSVAGANPNGDCMKQPTAKYPALEADYRELVRYAVEDRRAVWLTHIRDWGGGDPATKDQCFDPLTKTTKACTDATKGHLLAFAEWVRTTLSKPAARRIVIAHLGFLGDDPAALRTLLEAGLSVETASNIKELSGGGCSVREFIAQFPDQILWGTDAELGAACVASTVASWKHLLTGPLDVSKTFEGTCSGTVTIRGLALGSPTVAGCTGTLPANLLNKVQRDNARAILGL